MKDFFNEKKLSPEKPSVNLLAWQIVQRMIESRQSCGISVKKAPNGVTVLDAGIESCGGFLAGKIITEICMGGLAQAEIISGVYGELNIASIFVCSDNPALSTLGSQFAGWRINRLHFSAIGSGPARALALKPKKVYEEINYEDYADKAVLVLETKEFPPAQIVDDLVERIHVAPENLTLILVPINSVAGMTQVSGRIIETAVHRLQKLGLDPKMIQHAWGCAPIAPCHPMPDESMGRANDAILYGGIAHCIIKCKDDERVERIVREATSMTSVAYGRTFIETFKEAEGEFYKIDPNLFAPARITLTNLDTGSSYTAGRLNFEILRKSFGVN